MGENLHSVELAAGGGRLAVLRRVLVSPRLRRVHLAFLSFGMAEYGVWVSVLVYAYHRGGTTMAAVIAAVQLLPAAVVAPLASQLTDRRGAATMLRASYLIQAVSLLVTGAVFASGAPAAVGYACAALAASAVTLTRPAQNAIVPQIVRSPSELTAANATSAWTEGVSMLLGPALAGVLLTLGGAAVAVAAFGLLLVGSAALVGAPASPALAGGPPSGGPEPWLGAPEPAAAEHSPAAPERSPAAQAPGVLEVCARNRPIAALLALCFCQFVAEGASDVVVVVLAIDVLHLGSGAAGYLNAMFGAGAVLGGAGAVLLINRRPLSTPLLCAAASWGLAFLGLAVCHTAAAAFVSLAVAGAARTVLGTSARTMLHRVAPPAVLGRLFGSLEGIAMAGLAVGSLTVPVLAGIGGLGAALIGSGGLLLVVTLSVVVALRRLDTYGIAPTSRPAGGELIAGALATALSPAVR